MKARDTAFFPEVRMPAARLAGNATGLPRSPWKKGTMMRSPPQEAKASKMPAISPGVSAA